MQVRRDQLPFNSTTYENTEISYFNRKYYTSRIKSVHRKN